MSSICELYRALATAACAQIEKGLQGLQAMRPLESIGDPLKTIIHFLSSAFFRPESSANHLLVSVMVSDSAERMVFGEPLNEHWRG